MVDIATEGRTVLLSSHQIGEVERVADIVAIIHTGRVLLVEPLDALKLDTRQLTVLTTELQHSPPELPGTLLYQRQRGRQWELLVRGMEENDVNTLRDDEAVLSVESRMPSLEEIFIAYMRGEEPQEPNAKLSQPEVAGNSLT
jgi:ABC-2 type transport system ATP-binding protein